VAGVDLARPAGGATTPTPLPGAASRSIAQLLEGSPAPAQLLGSSSRGAWLRLGSQVIVLAGPGPARLPNGVAIGGSDPVFPRPGEPCVVGEGRLAFGDTEVGVVRWWDPRPALQPVTVASLAAAAAELRGLLTCPSHQLLASALDQRDVAAVRRAMLDLLGRGPGLTPEGDDVLAGVLAGLRLLGPAIGSDWAADMLRSMAAIIRADAPRRTTSLSEALLHHAAAGEVAGPVANLMQALTGRGDLSAAVARLRGLGATSGVAMGCGVLLAVDVLTKDGGR
jgi:hypothetical protein